MVPGDKNRFSIKLLTYSISSAKLPASMFLYNTILKPSSIHGLGVFAMGRIKKGTAVYQHSSRLDLILNADRFNKLDPRDQALIMHYGGIDKRLGRYRLPYDDLRFLNHSEKPNLAYDEATDQIIALRDIVSGEELTQDYRDFEDGTDSRLQEGRNPCEK